MFLFKSLNEMPLSGIAGGIRIKTGKDYKNVMYTFLHHILNFIR